MGKLVHALLGSLLLISCERSPTPAPPVVRPPAPTIVVPEVQLARRYDRPHLLAPMLQQLVAEQEEMLPFDEPRHEYGQQDGKLRAEWERAYYHHQATYTFNGDKYYTMYKGYPHVPQVCIDFVVDTLDRTAGTWYNPSLKYPKRVKGRYDLRRFITDQGFNARSADGLLQFFKQYPQDFQFLFEGSSTMEVSKTKELQSWLKQLDVQVGDLIIIRGRAPWDYGKEIHWHSMFVTGMGDEGQVELVTGNPVYPIERTLRIEMNRAPKRRVVAVIRFTDKFLGELTGLQPDDANADPTKVE